MSDTKSCPNKSISIGQDILDVTSPSYPSNYPDNIDCFWTFTSDQASGFLVVSIINVSLQLEGDFLTIGVGDEVSDSAVVLMLTGNAAPRIVTIDNEKMWLRFTTNTLSQNRRTGFWLQIEWQELQGKLLL